jgi:glutamyl-tRNA synthetase
LSDLLPVSLFFFKDPESHNKKSLKKFKTEENILLLQSLSDFFKTISNFNSIALKDSLEKIIFKKEWSFGKTLGLLRLAMVGELSGPDLFSLMQELKKETCIKRIATLLEVLKT